jgi:1,4-dihydroxy-2-naphthoate octaprenyltransferase
MNIADYNKKETLAILTVVYARIPTCFNLGMVEDFSDIEKDIEAGRITVASLYADADSIDKNIIQEIIKQTELWS